MSIHNCPSYPCPYCQLEVSTRSEAWQRGFDVGMAKGEARFWDERELRKAAQAEQSRYEELVGRIEGEIERRELDIELCTEQGKLAEGEGNYEIARVMRQARRRSFEKRDLLASLLPKDREDKPTVRFEQMRGFIEEPGNEDLTLDELTAKMEAAAGRIERAGGSDNG